MAEEEKGRTMNEGHTAAVGAVQSWLRWAARDGVVPVSSGFPPCDQIVNDVLLSYAEALRPEQSGWLPIASLPEGRHVLLYFAHGERGVGGIECGMVFFNHSPDGRWTYWTHGGPNSGSDWDTRDDERPTHWMPLPSPPLPGARP